METNPPPYLVPLEGVVERITYINAENGYTIARLMPPDDRELVTVVGNLASINVGESLRLQGRWTTHPRFGRQFQVERYQVALPASVEGMRRYLGSGLIKGIGPVNARRIVDYFGGETLEVIENEPHRLREVPGVGYKRVDMILRAWEEQKVIKEVMVFLQSLQISSSLAVRIYKQYGDASPTVVRERALPDGPGGVRHRLPHGGQDRPRRRHPPGVHRAGHGRRPPRPLPGHRRRPQLPAQAGAGGEERRDAGGPGRAGGGRPGPAELPRATSGARRPPDHEAIYLPPLRFAEVGIANRIRGLLDHPVDRLELFQQGGLPGGPGLPAGEGTGWSCPRSSARRWYRP